MRLTRVLLICGIAAAVLFIATDVVAALFLYPGYDYASQQVSELSAIGAPSRPVWMAMGYPTAVLWAAFAAGVWRAAGGTPSIRIAAVLIGLFTINSFLWGHLAPMHMRGTEFTGTDTMHIAFAASAVALMVGFISFGAAALGVGFKVYSATTIVAILVAGGVVSTQIPAIAAGLPTPWMGLVERVSVYGPVIWLAVFALALLPQSRADGRPRPAYP